ncbi:phage tail-collar fiber domain-containing protein [Shewanella algae]|uniref:phage tail-collar fiber domain-containing protein n=1 Tax=Shewanella algae TaxID=38313 RepID=UPI001183E65F|nr:phage tail protein [Shewanella algae]
MATVITKAGEALMARKAQANEQLDIDTFIFANVPGQDPAAPIDRDEGVPPVAQQVHQQQVQQYGRISDNIVVYSTVLSSTTGPFEFNWLGLYSSVNQTLVAIQHVPTVTKTVTAPGVAGNTLNRNFGIEYSGIAELTGINVAPETWQLDFTARLAGMDELTRQLAADMNGRDWFINDGFKVEPRSTLNSFRVLPGVGYVSGLRIELENEHIFNVQSYPQNVYVDAWFDGTAESVWRPNVAFTVSNTEMDDYIDVNGVKHYVFKLSVLNSASDAEDLRNVDGLAQKLNKHMEKGTHPAAAIDWSQEGVNPDLIAGSTATGRLLGFAMDSQVANAVGTGFEKTTEKRALHAVGVAESGSLSIDYDFTRLDGIGVISTDPTKNHAWLAPADGTQWIKVRLPFSVVIGDSIAEGHPACHGRLHASYANPTFDNNVVNNYGCPAFELSRRTGIHWFNHGIGGQTSAEVLARFDRDALGNTVAVGDGRPDTTLPGQPVAIWVNVGINDISQGIEPEVVKQNLLKMALKAKQHGIIIGFNTIGPVNDHDATKNQHQDEINRFILTVLPLYGAKTFDFKTWFADPEDNTKINAVFDADGTHPNKTGYTNYVSRLLEAADLPLYMTGLWLETGIGEAISGSFSRPTKVSMYNSSDELMGTFKLDSSVEFIAPKVQPQSSPEVKLLISEVSGGNNPARHSGFSAIKATLGHKAPRQSLEQTLEPKQRFGAHLVKVAGTWQVYAGTASNGVSGVQVSGNDIVINFSKGINNPQAGMIGSTQPSLYAAVADAVDSSSCRVKVFDAATGAARDPATMQDNSGFSITAWSV